MVSQLTVYAKILCLLMTLFSAGASNGNDFYLQSACNLKFLRAKNGSVFADDNVENGQPQVFNLNATRTRDNRAAVTIYSKETDSYICFDKNWRTKAMRGKANMSKRRCMFFENIDATGAFRYRSVVNQNRSLGFQRNGKPIGGLRAGGGAKVGPGGGAAVGRKRPIDEKCYSFNPMQANKSNDVQQYSQPHQRQEPKVARPHQQQQQQQQQQSSQLQPRQRHHRQQQQDQRKDVVSAGDGGNALLASSYSGGAPDQRQQSPPHRHRHKHGAGGRQGKLPQGHPNLDGGGFTGATAALPSATLSAPYGSNGGYGKGTHHRRTHLNSPVPGDTTGSMLPSALSALVTKLPPKSAGHAGHLGATALGLLDAGGGAAGGMYRKERPAMEPTNGRVSSGHPVGANGKKKSPHSNNGTSGRNASTKVGTMRGRDKRASG